MKQAYLVLGPESSGTHLVTDILVGAGCIGHSGNHSAWQVDKPDPGTVGLDDQPWDNRVPHNETPIVWRKSVPHTQHATPTEGWVELLRDWGYQVTAVVVVRDQHAMIQSQMKWGHVKDGQAARAKIRAALANIFSGLVRLDCPFVITTYEALVHYPAAQDRLLQELGLPLPEKRFEAFDGNKKWYAPKLPQRPSTHLISEGDDKDEFEKQVQAGVEWSEGLAEGRKGATRRDKMTVRELIESLEPFDDDAIVMATNGDGDYWEADSLVLGHWSRSSCQFTKDRPPHYTGEQAKYNRTDWQKAINII